MFSQKVEISFMFEISA